MTDFAFIVPTIRAAQFKRPQEITGLFEVGTDGENFVNQIFNTNDVEFSKLLFDDLIVRKSYSLLADFTVTTLVDKLANRLEIGIAIGNVRLDETQHLHSGLGNLDKDTVANLTKTKKLQNFACLRRHLVNTFDADDKGKLVLSGNVVAAG